ncbi:hypothetical protein HanIR_Chr11g0505651 [Helianthus annuus]|nr:hypothetical protein HanIR_Chr11g0505651 [Helianthus annuus]
MLYTFNISSTPSKYPDINKQFSLFTFSLNLKIFGSHIINNPPDLPCAFTDSILISSKGQNLLAMSSSISATCVSCIQTQSTSCFFTKFLIQMPYPPHPPL